MHAVRTSATAASASASAPPNHKGSRWGGGAATYILEGVVVANCVSSSAALRTSPYLSIRAEKWRKPYPGGGAAPSKNNPSRRSESSSSDLRKSATAVAHLSDPRAMDASNRRYGALQASPCRAASPALKVKKAGAVDVYVFITHAVLSGTAVDKIKKSKIKKLIITDTIDNSKKIKNNNKIEVLSISSLMAEAIKRIANSNSVSDLFN